jgi:hypothetical protein
MPVAGMWPDSLRWLGVQAGCGVRGEG